MQEIITEYIDDCYVYRHSLSTAKNRLFSNHVHNCFEIIFILKGKLTYGFEGNCAALNKNDILITPPLVHHFLQTSDEEEYQRVNIMIYPEKFNERISMQSVTVINKYSNSVIYSIFESIFYYLSVLEKRDYKSILDLKIKELIFALNNCTDGTHSLPKSLSPNMEKILNYINKNIRKPLTVKDISEHCYLSQGYLHYLFKSQLKTTPISYIKMKKMILAQNLLSEGVKTAAEVADELGFLDYSVFYRNYVSMFKKSPKSTLL